MAAFLGADAVQSRDLPGRAPATQFCRSAEEARRWVEEQAAAVDLPVQWVSEPPAH